MRGPAKVKYANLIRTARSALIQIALASIFSAVVALMGSAAQACPGGKHGVHRDAGSKVFVNVVFKAAAAATTMVAPGHANTVSPCSGPNYHCSSGCCSAGVSALNVSNLTLAGPEGARDIAVVDLGEGSSLKPPPNFRPPQIA